jgi:ABC-type transporter Mla MlaB component
MLLHSAYIAQENRLDPCFQGSLDLTVALDIAHVCKALPSNLNHCIIDLTEIERLFDSGLALLQALHRKLVAGGANVLILS